MLFYESFLYDLVLIFYILRVIIHNLLQFVTIYGNWFNNAK